MLNSSRGILIIPFLIFTLLASAQINTVSPYSRLGAGQISAPDFSRALSFGGAMVGVNDPLNINLSNPASYASLGLTTFELGFKIGLLEQRQETPTPLNISNSSAGLRYFSVGVPLTSWWSSAAALKPYSFRGYAIASQGKVATTPGADSLSISNIIEGSGGLNQLIWGNAFKVADGLSLGVNAAFVFGKLQESTSIRINGNNTPNDTRIINSDNVRGINIEAGALYTMPLKNDRELSLGVTFANASNLSANSNRLTYTYAVDGTGIERPVDSLVFIQDKEGTFTLPGSVAFGASYGKGINPNTLQHAWLLSADYHLNTGSQFRDATGNSQGLVDGFRAEAGALFTPRYAFTKFDRSNAYWSAVEYRFGAFYENTPLRVSGSQITDYGITFGLGLPVRQRGLAPGEVKVSTVNTGIVLGRRGTLDNGLIQENYLNFFIGITLNDKWFIKYKYR